MDIRQRRIARCAPVTAAIHCREFPGHGMGGGTQVEHGSLPKLGRGSWESRGAKGARVHRAEHQEGESYTNRELWKFAEGPPPVFS